MIVRGDYFKSNTLISSSAPVWKRLFKFVGLIIKPYWNYVIIPGFLFEICILL